MLILSASSCKELSSSYESSVFSLFLSPYHKDYNSEDKKNDCFLATDCIGTEKMVSGEYNSNVFVFGDTNVRKLLADIQIEEQNHAEMLYKYKTVNGMA